MNPLKHSDFVEIKKASLPVYRFNLLNEKLIEFLLKVKVKTPTLKCGVAIADKLALNPRLKMNEHSAQSTAYLYIGNCKLYLETDFETNPNEIYYKKSSGKLKIVEE